MRLVLDARTASFGGLIDFAGVFPPASLSVEDAVHEYATAREGGARWALGRFLIRASQLEQLGSVATRSFVQGEPPWALSVVFDVSTGASTTLATEFQNEMAPAMSVGAIESRLSGDETPDSLIDSASAIDHEVATFVEVDTARSLRGQIAAIDDALRDRGRTGGAKLRCGGVTADLFPSVGTVAEFVWEASLMSVPFKATAGLHHPVRHFDDNLDVWRHGFVNILMASAACDGGEGRAVVEAIVAESDPEAFSVGAAGAAWKDVMLQGSAIRRSRMHGFTAYGSCDFDEPVLALGELGFLGEGT